MPVYEGPMIQGGFDQYGNLNGTEASRIALGRDMELGNYGGAGSTLPTTPAPTPAQPTLPQQARRQMPTRPNWVNQGPLQAFGRLRQQRQPQGQPQQGIPWWAQASNNAMQQYQNGLSNSLLTPMQNQSSLDLTGSFGGTPSPSQSAIPAQDYIPSMGGSTIGSTTPNPSLTDLSQANLQQYLSTKVYPDMAMAQYFGPSTAPIPQQGSTFAPQSSVPQSAFAQQIPFGSQRDQNSMNASRQPQQPQQQAPLSALYSTYNR